MALQRISQDEYLDKQFDYSKLTKQELRQIMSENYVEDIPNLTSKKSVILESYKVNIYDRINELKGNFSTDNVFQGEHNTDSKPKQKRQSIPKIEESETKSSFDSYEESEQINEIKDDKNSKKKKQGNNKNSSFQNDSILLEDIHSTVTNNMGSSFMNKSFDFEEANSTIENKFKTPFIALPKSKFTDSKLKKKIFSNLAANERRGNISYSQNSPRRTCFFLKFFLLVVLGFSIYLKFFCPYCNSNTKNSFICITIPPHTKLINDNLVVDEGYVLVNSIVDFCVPDRKTELSTLKSVNNEIKNLEYLKGDFKYGFKRNYKIQASTITDPKVYDLLIKSSKVVYNNGFFEATHSRITFKNFLKFYLYFFIKITVVLLALSIFLKMYLNKRRSRNQLKIVANGIAKEVLDTLNRQIMMSVRSSQFKPFISSEQLRDALEIKEDVWKFVDDIISKNSNVEKSLDVNGKTAWKWVGPVLYKSSEGIEFQ